METKNCIKCKEEINPLRLKALPGTKTCVECSDVKGRKVVTKTYGEGDHTWNDIEFVDEDE